MLVPLLGLEASVVGLWFDNGLLMLAHEPCKGVVPQRGMFAGQIQFRSCKPERVQEQVLGHCAVGIGHFRYRGERCRIQDASISQCFLQLLLSLADVGFEAVDELTYGFPERIQTEHNYPLFGGFRAGLGRCLGCFLEHLLNLLPAFVEVVLPGFPVCGELLAQ